MRCAVRAYKMGLVETNPGEIMKHTPIALIKTLSLAFTVLLASPYTLNAAEITGGKKDSVFDPIEAKILTCIDTYNVLPLLSMAIGGDKQPGDDEVYSNFVTHDQLEVLDHKKDNPELNQKCKRLAYGFAMNINTDFLHSDEVSFKNKTYSEEFQNNMQLCMVKYKLIETTIGSVNDEPNKELIEATNYYINGHLILSRNPEDFTMKESIQCAEIADGFIYSFARKILIKAIADAIPKAFETIEGEEEE